MKLKSFIPFIFLTIVVYTGVEAEHSPGLESKLDTINIAQIRLAENIRKSTLWYTDSTRSLSEAGLFRLEFTQRIPEFISTKVSPSLVEKDVYLKFFIKNGSNASIRFYFLPGFYFQSIQLYKVDPRDSNGKALANFPHEPLGFKKLALGANEAMVVLAKLRFIESTVNTLDPVLIQEYYLPSYITDIQNSGRDINIITYVFTGILLMMIFYSIAVFMQNRNMEFLYYSGYAFCMAVLFFLKSYLYKTPASFNYTFESYLDFVIHSVGTFIYVAYLRQFIDSKKRFPFLHKMFLIEQMLIIVSLLLFSYLYFTTDYFVAQDLVEQITKYLWSLSTIIFIVYAIRVRNRLLNILAIGHFFLLSGGLMSLYLVNFPTVLGKNVPSIFNNSLLYYEIGLAIELMFFLAALAFKNKTDIVERTKEGERLKLKSERQEFEKQLAVFGAKQEERNRISADMHDELGSGVTAIRLMSEIVKTKMKENTLPEINRISSSANDLINKMNTIIWTMKSENDSLESLVTYIRTYALEFFENTPIECIVNIPGSLPNIELSGEKRRNIFLSVKETLNNVLKHSKAGKVIISFVINPTLLITIIDDGLGINFQKLREFGSGLSNIKKRIEGIQGEYIIENNKGTGTKTTFKLVI